MIVKIGLTGAYCNLSNLIVHVYGNIKISITFDIGTIMITVFKRKIYTPNHNVRNEVVFYYQHFFNSTKYYQKNVPLFTSFDVI